MSYRELRHDQARQALDAEQVFAAYRTAKAEFDNRFAGSMSWKTIGGGRYLYRKVGGSGRSLGVRSPETERIFEHFQAGRARKRDLVRGLAQRLNEMAPVNRALGLGRMPVTGARILRLLDGAGLLGRAVTIVGTNALYAYERMAGVQIDGSLMATVDVDLLLDARRTLRLAAPDLSREGLIGLLRKADGSFTPSGRGSFRAVNRDGFMVDLIRPVRPDELTAADRIAFGRGDDDLQAVAIAGLAWLVNSPKRSSTVIDERGYPLALSVPDPRSFALHKAWLAARDDRDPLKRRRDEGQARLIASLVVQKLPHLRFDADDLSALPAAMRRAGGSILPDGPDEGEAALVPNW